MACRQEWYPHRKLETACIRVVVEACHVIFQGHHFFYCTCQKVMQITKSSDQSLYRILFLFDIVSQQLCCLKLTLTLQILEESDCQLTQS